MVILSTWPESVLFSSTKHSGRRWAPNVPQIQPKHSATPTLPKLMANKLLWVVVGGKQSSSINLDPGDAPKDLPSTLRFNNPYWWLKPPSCINPHGANKHNTRQIGRYQAPPNHRWMLAKVNYKSLQIDPDSRKHAKWEAGKKSPQNRLFSFRV